MLCKDHAKKGKKTENTSKPEEVPEEVKKLQQMDLDSLIQYIEQPVGAGKKGVKGP